MLIAVTDNDETNMIACQVAYTLFQVPMKIARVRSSEYLIQEALFKDQAIPIDFCISPELLVTNYIKRLIEHPSALQVIEFSSGGLQLVGMKPLFGGNMVGKSILELTHSLKDITSRIVAIYRGERSIDLNEKTTVEIGDEVFFIAEKDHVRQVMATMRRLDNPIKKVMITGGGNIGSRLAEALENEYQVKLIDHNHERAKFLSEKLNYTTVLQGDASDKDLLISENIEYTDIYCSLTNDDEANIMSSMLAKRLGARTVMALVTRTAYIELIESSTIDIAISPQNATIGSILTHIRKGDVVRVHSLRRGAAEAIEIIAHGDLKNSKVVGRRINEIKLPKSTNISAIIRDHKVIINCDNTTIEPGDHVVILVTNKKSVKDVEKLFQVNVNYIK